MNSLCAASSRTHRGFLSWHTLAVRLPSAAGVFAVTGRGSLLTVIIKMNETVVELIERVSVLLTAATSNWASCIAVAAIVWCLAWTAVQLMLLQRYLAATADLIKTSTVQQSSAATTTTAAVSAQAAGLPNLLVILCLRGTDPFLGECLSRLLGSSYPNLTARIVVDSDEDPALPVVRQILDEQADPRVELMILPRRRRHCSGKVSGLLHATQMLPDGCDVVAWIDGDSLLHPRTLADLVSHLNDPAVGVVSGNRWYHPTAADLSSQIRMAWNAFALPVMNGFGIPWGGCLAVRAADMSHPVLRKRLRQSFIEDSTIATYVRDTGRKTRFAPMALLLNREAISTKNCLRFVSRQLFTVRRDNGRWPMIAAYMLCVNSTLLLGWIPSLFVGGELAAVSLASFLFLLTTLLAALPLAYGSIHLVEQRRGGKAPAMTLGQWFLLPTALVATNILNLVATVNAMTTRKLTWRGITYDFTIDHRARVVDVKPLVVRRLATLRSTL